MIVAWWNTADFKIENTEDQKNTFQRRFPLASAPLSSLTKHSASSLILSPFSIYLRISTQVSTQGLTPPSKYTYAGRD